MRTIIFIVVFIIANICTGLEIRSAGFVNPALRISHSTLLTPSIAILAHQEDSVTQTDTARLDTAADSDSFDSSTVNNADTVPKQIAVYDSSTVDEKLLSQKDLQEYLNDKAFAYDRAVPDQTSLWEMFKRWFWETIERLLGTNAGGKIGDALIYILIAVAIAVVNIILFRSNLGGLFGGKNSKANIGFTILDENIHAMNFSDLIADAEAKSDYRHAIRLQYLWLLKRLSDDSIIELKINKTNRDYRNEIKDPELKHRFSRASIIFEYVWYGEGKIDSENYQAAVQFFVSPVSSEAVR